MERVSDAITVPPPPRCARVLPPTGGETAISVELPTLTGMFDLARRIHDQLPVVDGHNDLPWEIRTRAGGSLDAADPTKRLDGYHTDFPRLLEGGVGVQFWSVFVPAWSARPLEETHRQIDLVEEMTRRAAEYTALADDAAEAETIRDGGRVAGLIGAEGGHCLENDLEALEGLRRRGVRYLTLTHADTIDWADSATDEPRHGGQDAGLDALLHVLGRVSGHLVDQLGDVGRPVDQRAREVLEQRALVALPHRRERIQARALRHRRLLALADRRGDVLVAGDAQRVLRAEVVDHEPGRHAGVGGDGADAGRGDAVLGEAGDGGVADAGTCGAVVQRRGRVGRGRG